MLGDLPISIAVGRVFVAFHVETANLFVQNIAPQLFEPTGLAKPIYNRRADGVVEMDKSASMPCFGEGEIAIAAERPYLRAIIGAIYRGRDIASALDFRRGIGAVLRFDFIRQSGDFLIQIAALIPPRIIADKL